MPMPPNIRWFIMFRVFFNARFYYPVYAIMFLDFGLDMEQFAVLNVIWAIVIVCLEVPSGALADLMGRRNLVALAGGLMVVEIGLLCFVPLGNVEIIFGVFVINRVLSGTAEAAASGADEALAYDTLQAVGRSAEWPRVLDMLMRWQSGGFFFAMILGALLYDPDVMQRLVDFLGIEIALNQQMTLRFPLYLNLVTACLALVSGLKMRDVKSAHGTQDSKFSIRDTFGKTLSVGRWIMKTPLVLVTIASLLVMDSICRLFLTVGSEYYRLIDLPEASYGLIGSVVAVIGFVVSPIARKLAQIRTPRFNFWVTAIILGGGLLGIAQIWPYYGVLFAMLVSMTMTLMSFFSSHYINALTGSDQRATVLSFKGLAINLAYGGLGLLFALLIHRLENQNSIEQIENVAVLSPALLWFPGFFGCALSLLLVFNWWHLGGESRHHRPISAPEQGSGSGQNQA